MSAENAKCLVIVDDERSYTDLLGQLLADHLTCPIRTFNQARQAFDALGELEIGLLVTDYSMPQVSGLELIRQLQTVAPGAPAIIITGHSVELEQMDLSDLHALRATVAKPFNWRALADEIVKSWPAALVPVRAPGNAD